MVAHAKCLKLQESSSASLLVARAKCLKPQESSSAPLLVAHDKCLKPQESSCASKVAHAKCLSTTKVSFSEDADAKTNNASFFRHTASSTLQLVVVSIDDKFSKGSTKSNNTLPFSGKPNKSINGESTSSTFQLVVTLIWIVSPEGVQAPSNIQVYCCINFVASIIIPNFEEASTLIVGYHYSKISLPFCKDCRIFCEGEWEQ